MRVADSLNEYLLFVLVLSHKGKPHTWLISSLTMDLLEVALDTYAQQSD